MTTNNGINYIKLLISKSPFIIASILTENESGPIVLVFYTQETGFSDYLKHITWAKQNGVSLILINIQGNWQPKDWYLSWSNYKLKKKEISRAISDVISLNLMKRIYFLSNSRTDTIIIDILKNNYPLHKYVKGFLDENQNLISYTKISPLKSSIKNLEKLGIKGITSPFLIKAFICYAKIKIDYLGNWLIE